MDLISRTTCLRNCVLSVLLAASAIGAHAETRAGVALAVFHDACLAKQWARCHAAWRNLFDAGMRVEIDGSGDDVLSFPHRPEATRQYGAIAQQLDTPAMRADWDAFVLPLDSSRDMRAAIPARLGLFDREMKDAALEVAQQRLDAKRVPYNTHAVLKGGHAEWLRYMALVYLSRDDQTNAHEAEAMLEQVDKGHRARVQALRKAIDLYFAR